MAENLDTKFFSNMLGYSNSPSYYPIKRSFGQTLQTCDMDALIAYTKLSQNKNPIDQNIEFLIAGLCYNSIRPGQERPTYVRFEDVLARIHRPEEIEKFLKLRYDNDGYFAKRFYTLARKAIACLQSFEQFDYIKLYKDLKYWNDNNSVKMKWAMAIARADFETEE